MDRNKEREKLWQITDSAVRAAETARMLGEEHLDSAVRCLLTARKQYPSEEVHTRVLNAVKEVLYISGVDPSYESTARLENSQKVLDAEFR